MPRHTDNTWLERISGYFKGVAGVKSGSNDGNGDVMKVGGEYNSTPYTYTSGSRVSFQTDSQGRIKTSPGALSTSTDSVSVLTIATTTATSTSVASSATLLAANANRRAASIFNDSTQIAYVKFGATASTTSYKVQLFPNAYYEFPIPIYTGIVDALWASANGNARIDEEV